MSEEYYELKAFGAKAWQYIDMIITEGVQGNYYVNGKEFVSIKSACEYIEENNIKR